MEAAPLSEHVVLTASQVFVTYALGPVLGVLSVIMLIVRATAKEIRNATQTALQHLDLVIPQVGSVLCAKVDTIPA